MLDDHKFNLNQVWCGCFFIFYIFFIGLYFTCGEIYNFKNNSVSFDNCMYPCNPHTYQDIEYSYPYKKIFNGPSQSVPTQRQTLF